MGILSFSLSDYIYSKFYFCLFFVLKIHSINFLFEWILYNLTRIHISCVVCIISLYVFFSSLRDLFIHIFSFLFAFGTCLCPLLYHDMILLNFFLSMKFSKRI